MMGFQLSPSNKTFSVIIPKKDGYKYFGNLWIMFEGNITNIIDISNQDLSEIK